MARGCKNEFLEAAQIKLVTEIVCTFCNISQIFQGFCIFVQNFTDSQFHTSSQRPQTQNLKPKPQAEQKKNQQNVKKSAEKHCKILTKNVKNQQKLKKTQKNKTRQKNKKIISKSNTQPKQKQNQYNV